MVPRTICQEENLMQTFCILGVMALPQEGSHDSEIIGLIFIFAVLYFLFRLLTSQSREETEQPGQSGNKKVVEKRKDGSGSATWEYVYFEDHTGYRLYNHYGGGEVVKTTRRPFIWTTRHDPVTWCGKAEVIFSRF
jgi:hypothetical protein